MAKTKWWKRKRSSTPKKKYTPEEKYRYHKSRERSCGKYGIKFGSPAHCYSSGFADAFHGRDNTGGYDAEFGKKSGNAYALGYKRGRKAMWDYVKSGKQPGDLD